MKKVELTDSHGQVHKFEFDELPKITVDGKSVIFEPEKTEFKKGDIIYWSGNNKSLGICIGVCKSFPEDSYNCFLLSKMTSNNISCYYGNLRLATSSEKQKLFDALEKEGKRWDAEKMEIVDLKYIPKVGDCVKATRDGFRPYVIFSVSEINHNEVKYKNRINEGIFLKNEGKWIIASNSNFEKLTPEQFQAEFNKLGYEYNFETHEAKKLQWKPEIGEEYWYVSCYSIEICIWDDDAIDNERLNYNNVHQTKEETEQHFEWNKLFKA